MRGERIRRREREVHRGEPGRTVRCVETLRAPWLNSAAVLRVRARAKHEARQSHQAAGPHGSRARRRVPAGRAHSDVQGAGTVTVLESSATAALWASALPSSLAPVLRVIARSALIVPTKAEVV